MTDVVARDLEQRVRALVRDVPDYPKPGIMFKDITPLLGNPATFRAACDAMAASFQQDRVTHVAAIESRGFLFGSPIALSLGAGAYLSKDHFDDRDGSCPMIALPSDVAGEGGTQDLPGASAAPVGRAPIGRESGGLWSVERRPLTVGLVLTITLVAAEALAVSTAMPIVAASGERKK